MHRPGSHPSCSQPATSRRSPGWKHPSLPHPVTINACQRLPRTFPFHKESKKEDLSALYLRYKWSQVRSRAQEEEGHRTEEPPRSRDIRGQELGLVWLRFSLHRSGQFYFELKTHRREVSAELGVPSTTSPALLNAAALGAGPVRQRSRTLLGTAQPVPRALTAPPLCSAAPGRPQSASSCPWRG